MQSVVGEAQKTGRKEEREKVSLARDNRRDEGFYVTCYRENKRSAAGEK